MKTQLEDSMKLRTLAATLMALAALSFAGSVSVTAATSQSEPPGAPYQPLSKLTPLPQFLPGLGSLYVDPATLPVGPFLGYDRKGKLVVSIYMVPLKAMDAQKSFLNLAVGEKKPDHVTVEFNPGHPGVQEFHYHFNVWYISPQEVAALK
jgi:hypothetical protein